MKLTQRDYRERVVRLADGTSPDPDDDRRLVKLYEREGYGLESPQAVDEPVEEEQPKPRGRRRSL